ncbi:hypothetical protein TNCV_4805121 [Trichonephila clavipes]|nr:hypothetical protein TNCV_4805121 [Trichonephila clavipes]
MVVRVYEDQALSMKCVYEWFARLREARESVSETPIAEDWRSPSVTKTMRKLEKSSPVKPQICNISADRLITKTIARLRTGHHRGMKIDRDGRRIIGIVTPV